jgi:mRNA interferase MazF
MNGMEPCWMGWRMKQMKRGEIWLVDLNPIIGREQAGTRPALIISADEFNESGLELLIVCPVTSKYKGFPTHVELKAGNGGLIKDSYIKAEDIRSISTRRFIKKIGKVDTKTMSKIENILQKILKI